MYIHADNDVGSVDSGSDSLMERECGTIVYALVSVFIR